MKHDCKKLVDAYLDWLKTTFTCKNVAGQCEITTPFLDRHNDRLQIYVQPLPHGGIRLTDDSYIISDLEMSGCALDTPQRQKMLQTILNGYGISQENGELFVETSVDAFPKKKHALIQAMMTVNDMFMTAKHHVASFFFEDVMQFLEVNDVRYSPNVDFIGKSGYAHSFDFLIPKSKSHPERLLRAINNPNKNSAVSLLFAWTDTKEVRPPNSVAYAVLNDLDKSLSPDIQSAFQHYAVKTMLWSERDRFIPELIH